MKVVIALGLLAALALFTVFPRPADVELRLSLHAERHHVQWGTIRSADRNQRYFRAIPRFFLPRSVTFTTDGAPVDVYLLDLDRLLDGRVRLDAMDLALSEIEAGRQPTAAPVVASAADATNGRFELHRWPWGDVRYTVVVAGRETAEITFRTDYGG